MNIGVVFKRFLLSNIFLYSADFLRFLLLERSSERVLHDLCL